MTRYLRETEDGCFQNIREGGDVIKCAFHPNSSCYIECAACQIFGTNNEVKCKRFPTEDNEVGVLRED